MIKKIRRKMFVFAIVSLFVVLTGGLSRTYAKEVSQPQKIVSQEIKDDRPKIETNIVVIDASDRHGALDFNEDEYLENLMVLALLLTIPATAIALFWNV